MAQTDREALVALYSATDGPNWERKTNWGSGAPLSDWYGVTTNGQGRVVKLSLSFYHLQGMFKPTLRTTLSCDVSDIFQEFVDGK